MAKGLLCWSFVPVEHGTNHTHSLPRRLEGPRPRWSLCCSMNGRLSLPQGLDAFQQNSNGEVATSALSDGKNKMAACVWPREWKEGEGLPIVCTAKARISGGGRRRGRKEVKAAYWSINIVDMVK